MLVSDLEDELGAGNCCFIPSRICGRRSTLGAGDAAELTARIGVMPAANATMAAVSIAISNAKWTQRHFQVWTVCCGLATKSRLC